MVKRDGKFKALTGMTLSFEFLASMAMLFMAMENVSILRHSQFNRTSF
jgi:hypothetical protein